MSLPASEQTRRTPSNFWPQLIVFLAPFTLFALPLLLGKVLFWGTPMLQFIPWRAYAYQQMEQGIFPLWNPLNGMGAPLMANYQTALFYPPAAVFYAFYQMGGISALAWVFTLSVPVHLGWAGLGTACLLEEMGLGKRSQIVGGLAFGLSAYLMARSGFISMIWAGAWMPWIVLSVEYLIRGRGKIGWGARLVPLILTAAMQLLAGHAQLTWYTLLFSGLWLLVRSDWRPIWNVISNLAGFLSGIVAACALALAQLLPTFEYLLQSDRANAYNPDLAMTYSFWPWHLLTFLFPGMFGNPGVSGGYWGFGAFWEDAVYIGLVGFILAFSTLGVLFRKGAQKPTERRSLFFLWGIMVVAILLALGNNTPLFPWLFDHVPTFDMFQAPSRWMIWVVFSLCVLAGIAADSWRRPGGKRRSRYKLGVVIGIATVIGAGAGLYLLKNENASMFYAVMVCGALLSALLWLALQAPAEGADPRKSLRWQALVIGLMMVDLVCANASSVPFMEGNFYTPEKKPASLSEAESSGRLYLSASAEYDLKFERFLTFSSFKIDENWGDVREVLLPDLNLLEGKSSANNFDPLVPARYATWIKTVDQSSGQTHENFLKEMGVTAWEQADPNDLSKVKFTAVEDSGNRVEWAPCATPAADGPVALKLVQEKMTDAALNCIIVEAAPAAIEPSSGQSSTGQAEIVEDKPDEVVISVQADRAGWLRLADTWYPGWVATIDGQPTRLYQADYLFEAVQLSAGEHLITIKYRPIPFTVGALVSIFGWLILIGVIFALSGRNFSAKQV